MKRPGLLYILELCENKKIDMLVTLKPSILARDTLLYLELCEKIKSNGVEVYFNESSQKVN